MIWQKSGRTAGQSEDASGGPVKEPHRVVSLFLATDLSARSDRAFDRAVERAHALGASLKIFHLVDGDLAPSIQDRAIGEANRQIDILLNRNERVRALDVSVDVVTGHGHADILTAAAKCRADIIIVGPHRYEKGFKPFAGTTTERLIRGGSIPTLLAAKPVSGAYKKVVVGLDFSVHSRFALRCALALAPDAEIHAVHAFQVPFQGFMSGADTRAVVQEDHEKAFAALVEQEMDILLRSSAVPSEARVFKIVRNGEAATSIYNEVERVKPDLLALGTHGRAGIAQALIGSVAERFLSAPQCDVLAVKAW